MSECPIHGRVAPGHFYLCCARASEQTREREMAELQRLGDAMADAIENRWSGPGGCDCEVCSTAKAWRARA